jgi:hypothetical protein
VEVIRFIPETSERMSPRQTIAQQTIAHYRITAGSGEDGRRRLL